MLRVEVLAQSLHYMAAGPGLPLLHRQPGLAPDHLQRLLQHVPYQAGAQDVVALDHCLQRQGEGVQVLAPGEGEQRVLLVGIAGGGHVVIEQALLQRRQG
ncbi:hypothetical protein PBOI14_26680 [Pseudomonas sp. Boi14]|nr:hypothetical protein PBOI14_26680 [Pseudomonas sp. Boi14]